MIGDRETLPLSSVVVVVVITVDDVQTEEWDVGEARPISSRARRDIQVNE